MSVTILSGDCRSVLPTLAYCSVQCCVTSPPYYGLRDYGVAGQIGLEQTPDEYVAQMVSVFREVRRVLRDDGTLWLNLGDSYARVSSKGGSGPNGKNGAAYGDAYGLAQSAKVGSSDGIVGRGSRPRSCSFSEGVKEKDLLGIPWMVAFALRADGWYLRSDVIWAKPNPMPESVTDRPTSAHEHVFLFSKSARYFYDADAIREPHTCDPDGLNDPSLRSTIPSNAGGQYVDGGLRRPPSRPANYFGHALGRNARNVWTIATQPYSGAHFATMPPELAERCVKAGSKPGDTVLDPFGGAGTTALVADRLGRNATLIEINAEYRSLAEARITADSGMFAQVAAA